MKTVFKKIRNRIIAGFIFLIPIFILLSVAAKLWNWLTEYADKVAKLVHFDAGENKLVLAIVSIVINLFIIYLFGWLVNIALLKRFRDWIENTILQYIPGYLTYRSQMISRVEKKDENRKPALVETPIGFRPGLIVAESENAAMVFFPSAPDTNNGIIETVSIGKVKRIEMRMEEFLVAIQSPDSGELLRIAHTS